MPSEWAIEKGVPRLLGGDRAHQHPALVDAVATPVLAAALPLLRQLRRPALLLEDSTLQVEDQTFNAAREAHRCTQ